jgi:5-methylcytosine-specific restriction endonuclease McrA
MVVFARKDGKGTPLYWVAGLDRGPMGAEKALRAAHEIHGGECFYCKQAIAEREFTIDHVEPDALGGKAHLQNLVVAHKACNLAKGHQVIEAYNADAGREWLNALLRQVQDRLNRL